MKKIIVCGASKNLGNYILKKLHANKVYNLSRTNTKNKNFLRRLPIMPQSFKV